MKKAMLGLLVAAGAPAAFLAAAVLFVNLRGGLDPAHAHLAKTPLVGALLKVRPAPAEEAAPPAPFEERVLAAGAEPAAPSASAPALMGLAAGQGNLGRLVEELERKKDEYDTMLLKVRRTSRELAAWERQLQTERETLLKSLASERAALETLRSEAAGEQERLRRLRVAIAQQEEGNLKKAAEIYSRMEPEQAARILQQMYVGGRQADVVKIVFLMQERAAANMLAAMGDQAVSAEITGQLTRVGRSEPAAGE